MSCTHCGICLESCPTYTLGGCEAESPRGRIVLIEDALAPGGGATAEMAGHIDSCLGCMACMTVCPEEVPYGDLLAAAQEAIERDVPRPPLERLRRQTALSAIPRTARLGRLDRRRAISHFTPAVGSYRGRVGLLLGCATRPSQSRIQRAAVSVLAAEGYEVIAPASVDCCGALDLQAGARDHGLARAQATINAFAAVGVVDRIVASSGACGAALKDYGRLLGTPEAQAFSALAVDVHELLESAPRRAASGPLALRIAYHDACRLCHGQGISTQPRSLLSAIPGVELMEIPPDAGACCGAPGIYRLTSPEKSASLGRRQAQAVLDLGADLVVSADPGCIGQLERHLRVLGSQLAVLHPVEVFARALHSARRSGDAQ
jgi:glycolate oxidase iron-sulfur subunit